MWVTEHLLSTDRRLASVAWDRTPCKQTGLAVGMGITRDSSPRGRHRPGRLASAAWDRTPCKQTGLAVGMGITRDSSPRGRHRPGRLASAAWDRTPCKPPVAWDRTPCKQRLSGSLHGHHPGLEPTGGKAPPMGGKLASPGARSHGRGGKLLLKHRPGLEPTGGKRKRITRGSVSASASPGARPTGGKLPLSLRLTSG